MTNKTNDSPAHEQRHYCRMCVDVFIQEENSTRNPHNQWLLHSFKEHRDSFTQAEARCGRNCLGREQPEEHRLKRRMYGSGIERQVPSPDRVRWYEQYFPDD